jgi:hypothetical protein
MTGRRYTAMIRHYCDYCGDEITTANDCTGGAVNCPDSRLGCEIENNGVLLRVEIMVAFNGKWNSGHACKYCVLDALNQLDDRDRIVGSKPSPIKVVPRRRTHRSG